VTSGLTTIQRNSCIAVDAMGGDQGPGEVVRGVVDAARASKMRFALVGEPSLLHAELARVSSRLQNVEIVGATQVIEMTDQPTVAFKKKPDASIVVAARMVKEKRADAVVSIGNTGAAMAVSLLTLGRIKGIDRPAIATPLPSGSKYGTTVLLDAGATVDCDPNNLYEFALMGAVYAEAVLGIPNPTVGLLSNGEEDTKGNELVKRTRALFQQAMQADGGKIPFRYYGNVEGRDVFRGTTDVVVCDGFVGNVFLKASEGVAEMILGLLKRELSAGAWKLPLVAPLRPSLQRVRGRIDYSERGGAPLLGINGICIIGHGRSNAYAVTNACRAAERAIEHNIINSIRQRVCDMPSPPPV
jgi:glycerol-3-phosphate acyltransferase PlsX